MKNQQLTKKLIEELLSSEFFADYSKEELKPIREDLMKRVD